MRMMARIVPALVVAATAAGGAVTLAQRPARLIGFTAAATDRERAAERVIAAIPSVEKMGEHHFAMTRKPHHTGSDANYQLALYLRDRYESFGYQTQLFKYDVLVPWPGQNRVSLVVPAREQLSLVEPPIPEDPDTSVAGALPPMLAYVASGDAEGEVVYANYGSAADYARLDAMGISLEGKIVLFRYGGTPRLMRGVKMREAAKRGAAGVLIYTDPIDDGYVRGDVYPNGTWRPPTGVERGSMLDVPLYPGDPLTPGRPSLPGIERLPFDKAESIQKIPGQVISYGEALKVLRHLGGPAVPREWQGGLPVTYHTGPGAARVSMHIEYDYQQRPVWNLIATIPGTVEPERRVLAGGHRDAWVMGARDPLSGAVSLLETARAVAEAVKQGFKPRRTIQFASWDGEDFFLLGSTEYGEQFAADLQKNMVAYINRESYTAGRWNVSGNNSLERFTVETARDAPHPSGKSLYAEWTSTAGGAIHHGALGSGSDFAVFIDHLGVPSLGPGFGGENGIQYHSLYDTLKWFQKFADPGYRYGAAQADMVARMVLRLANADVLPFDYTGTAEAIGRWVDELRPLDAAGELRPSLVALAASAIAMRAAAADANAAIDRLLDGDAAALPARELFDLNGLIMQVERDFVDPHGLPGRPWYRYLLEAPGYYTGYAAKTLPGVREAMEAQRWEVARDQAVRLDEAIHRATNTIGNIGTLAHRLRAPTRTSSGRQ
jgi:N-acetylated-alpha-linked acidic dipeptidase